MALRFSRRAQPMFPANFKRVLKLENGETLIVRRMDLNDLESVTELEHMCFTDAWTLEHFEYEVSQSQVSVPLVAEIQGELVGYIIPWFVEDEIHIANLAVSPLHRRKKIAEKLLQLVLKEGEKQGSFYAYLEVRVSNLPAIRLYRKFGFAEAGIRSNYYRDGEDALLMERYLGALP